MHSHIVEPAASTGNQNRKLTPVPKCPCGEYGHGPRDHGLWTIEHITAPARRSYRKVVEDRALPSCPLHGVGQGRGSRCLVFSWDEVLAYLAWIVQQTGSSL